MSLLLFAKFLGLLPLGLWILLRIKLVKPSRFFIPFLVLMFVASVYEIVFTTYLKIPVNHWFVFYNFAAFVTLFYFYYELLNRRYKGMFIGFALAFVALISYLFYNYSFNDHFVFSASLKMLQTTFILTLSVLWFIEVFKQKVVLNLFKSPVFYFISALILYYCGVLFVFLSYDYIYQNHKSISESIWSMNLYLTLLMRFLSIYGVWIARKT
uniref:hypothetical protein n=1 Tax=Flavobacterium sp. TaxID=239 RepID=UPI00404A4454